MPETEQNILKDLISGWVSLALEYSKGAPDVTGIYVYAASEQGEKYANIFFEQDGLLDYPSKLKGVNANVELIRRVHQLQIEDLRVAESQFSAAGVPAPTEYRIFYDPSSGRMETSLSREVKFSNHPTKIMENGPEDWLGDRLPKLFDVS